MCVCVIIPPRELSPASKKRTWFRFEAIFGRTPKKNNSNVSGERLLNHSSNGERWRRGLRGQRGGAGEVDPGALLEIGHGALLARVGHHQTPKVPRNTEWKGGLWPLLWGGKGSQPPLSASSPVSMEGKSEK